MKSNKYFWISLSLLISISALAYLPLVNKFGYINDDWYLMYDVLVHGSQFFHDIFGSDRPGRAYLMIPVYSLFGLDPLPYNITGYMFRVLGGISLFWVLRILWPERKIFALTATLFFTVYPGFLSQVNAIDYQSHLLALFLAILSIALTLKAILASGRMAKIILTVLAILTGLIALSQMEYYIGIEAFRLTCVAVLMWRLQGLDFGQKIRSAFMKWLPFSIVPVGFLFWRILLFQVERRATDIGSQLGQLFTSPLIGLWWLVYLIQDFFNVLLASWVIPFSMFVLPMRLQNQLIGFVLAALAIVLFVGGSLRTGEDESKKLTGSGVRETREQVFVGIISIVGGLVPVIAANRHIVFPDYSRYTLIASIGAVILLAVFICQFSSVRLKIFVTSLLIAVGVLTHYGNSVKTAADTKEVGDFWWQVAWRAPQIKSGATLSVTYPAVGIQEDYFIWGPANHIYFPTGNAKDIFQIDLSAVVLDDNNVSRIITERGQESFYRRGDILIVNDYSNVLVITQADKNSCVRIIDGKMPELSVHDQHRTMLIATNSKLDNIVTEGVSPTPSALIFGGEPLHEWCYYYQKADLARQRGDWDAVVFLYEEAVEAGFHPNDQIELMPFIQAYAYFGDQKVVKELSTRLKTNIFYTFQACRALEQMAERGYPLVPEMEGFVDELFCK